MAKKLHNDEPKRYQHKSYAITFLTFYNELTRHRLHGNTCITNQTSFFQPIVTQCWHMVVKPQPLLMFLSYDLCCNIHFWNEERKTLLIDIYFPVSFSLIFLDISVVLRLFDICYDFINLLCRYFYLVLFFRRRFCLPY